MPIPCDTSEGGGLKLKIKKGTSKKGIICAKMSQISIIFTQAVGGRAPVKVRFLLLQNDQSWEL